MVTYRRKPVNVRAKQWTGDNYADLIIFTDHLFRLIEQRDREDDHDAEVFVGNHNVWVPLRQGDWVLEDVNGDFYPCTDDVFQQIYEANT